MKNHEYLPEFPRTFHLPWQTREDGDPISSIKELNEAVKNHSFIVEEKVDGSNLGICLVEKHPMARGRKRFIHKGETKTNTSAKQFASFWNWFYDNEHKFKKLNEIGPFSVYGEWMVAQHGMSYDSLPCYFLAFDLYDYEKKYFVSPIKARQWLKDCEIVSVPQLDCNEFEKDTLLSLTDEKSCFAEGKREGVYIKFYNNSQITARYKLVRKDFIQGELWDNFNLKKNKLSK